MMTEYTCEEIMNLYMEESISNDLSFLKGSQNNNNIIPGSVCRDREFIARINHEVRTSMTAIIGFSQLLRQDGLSGEDKTAFAEYICQETEHLLKTFNHLLEQL
jgi:signal transduction histidine kinase